MNFWIDSGWQNARSVSQLCFPNWKNSTSESTKWAIWMMESSSSWGLNLMLLASQSKAFWRSFVLLNYSNFSHQFELCPCNSPSRPKFSENFYGFEAKIPLRWQVIHTAVEINQQESSDVSFEILLRNPDEWIKFVILFSRSEKSWNHTNNYVDSGFELQIFKIQSFLTYHAILLLFFSNSTI